MRSAKTKKKPPNYRLAAVRLVDRYRDNVIRKIGVLDREVRKGRQDWSWLNSLLSQMQLEPHGFKRVAVTYSEIQKVYALWFKEFKCLVCKRGGLHSHTGVCIKCEAKSREQSRKWREEETSL